MFTMFTSTKREGILKGQKKYYLSTHKDKPHHYTVENSALGSKVYENGKLISNTTDLTKCRKFSVDMSIFGINTQIKRRSKLELLKLKREIFLLTEENTLKLKK